MFDFTGQHVFVAGGTSGINLGIAHAFARCGAAVSVLSRSQDKVDAAVAALKAHGGAVSGFAADVRDYAKTEAALKAAHAAHGEIDVLISGAAGNFPAPALGISSNGFRAVVEIDLLGTFHVLRAGFPLLRKPGASIINISAPQAYNPMELQMHVCAAKAGVDMVTRVGAMEWGPLGVRINSVVPGPIKDTEGMKRLAPTPQLEQIVTDSVPLKRFGSKDDIAHCCLWLASPYASYVTGAVIPVDGGWSLGGTSVSSAGMKALLGG
ncbi:NAD(P)-dependent dehydrogenase, short-chain alcohol dehydrogenase family [Fontimonas thermophila]|uniref:NAD(P)-dependent dehydrogenase, short-chain alcohol dehydrogenase family n=1 Tax=Fontimonas thermophila TaxID=1076937 RepID=A0A1I2JVI3_9GAMM|nr:SDR family oxidoreductase [Fontimonas thermophila]SFF58189.1 NAD(P)-dependent dehydrogenase, short-chain alcohol dehydrogenase family [Fontimonas thermophila]